MAPEGQVEQCAEDYERREEGDSNVGNETARVLRELNPSSTIQVRDTEISAHMGS